MFNTTWLPHFLLGSKHSLMYLETFERILFLFTKIENCSNSLAFLNGCTIMFSLVKYLTKLKRQVLFLYFLHDF